MSTVPVKYPQIWAKLSVKNQDHAQKYMEFLYQQQQATTATTTPTTEGEDRKGKSKTSHFWDPERKNGHPGRL